MIYNQYTYVSVHLVFKKFEVFKYRGAGGCLYCPHDESPFALDKKMYKMISWLVFQQISKPNQSHGNARDSGK